MAGGNPGPIWVRGPFLLASGLFLLHGANGGTRGKRQPPACPGPGRQAQSRNSALTQMTQGISGSGARRWSVRKPCRAAQVQESSARCVLYRGGGGKRTAGPRRSRGPAGNVPRHLFGPFLDLQKGTRPAGRAPLWSARVGRAEGRHLTRHGIRRDAFPRGKGFWGTQRGPSHSPTKGSCPNKMEAIVWKERTVCAPSAVFCEIGLTGTYNFGAGAGEW